jgi:hypothetical protein
MNVEDGLSTYDTWLFHTVPNSILYKILKKNCNRMNKTSYNVIAKSVLIRTEELRKLKVADGQHKENKGLTEKE